MEIKILKITQESVNILETNEYADFTNDESTLYLFDIITDDRQKAVSLLSSFHFNKRVLEHLLKPREHIRFEVFENTTYGEIAFFSSGISHSVKYIGVIGFKNLVFFIHDKGEGLARDYIKELSIIIENKQKEIVPSLLLYILINQTLVSHAKLIITYREEMEEFAKDFDHKHNDIEPEDFLDLKSQLSDFSRVLEKLYFSLSFPPARKLLDTEGDYHMFFKDLLKTTEILKNNLNQTEQRLESLHNHYLLLLQDKSNKRINLLTIIQAIFVPLTLIAGIYGMNFQNMPELNATYGYYITLAVMALVTIGFIRYFYKQGWFE